MSTIKIHNPQKSTITLLTEVFETTRGENPNFMNKTFSQKRTKYQLKTINFISYPKITGSNTALISLGSASVNL